MHKWKHMEVWIYNMYVDIILNGILSEFISPSFSSHVAILCNTRCTTMAASSIFFPIAVDNCCTSLSRWPQKNSETAFLFFSPDLTSTSRYLVAEGMLQLDHTNAECIMTRKIQQAAADNTRWEEGTCPRTDGWPKQCPFWVVSVLK